MSTGTSTRTSTRTDLVRDLARRYRDDVRVGFVVLTVVSFLGVPTGLVWEAVTPRTEVISRPEGVFYTDPEGNAFIAADGWFAVIGAVAGVVCASVAFARYRGYGVATVLGLTVGGALASVAAWRMGHAFGPAELAAGARAARTGVPFSGPLDLRAHGVLLIWSLASITVFLALTAGHDAEDRPRTADPSSGSVGRDSLA